jgi:hypothetical protein
MMEDVDHDGIPQKRKSTEQVNMKTTKSKPLLSPWW